MSLALLAGPAVEHGAESYDGHVQRLGALPDQSPELLEVVEAAGLRGRGGARFPVAHKWRSVCAQRERAVVLVNGCESDPLSRKDRTLLRSRPHLVVDGALLAARAVDADRVVYYVGAQHIEALAALRAALRERPQADTQTAQVVVAPSTYVSGEESAAVHYVNRGVALPTATPPRPYERGVRGRPTLVHNVETLAHAALIARNRESTRTALVTVGGGSTPRTVLELPADTTVRCMLELAGAAARRVAAVLVGGLSGTWLDAQPAMDTVLDCNGVLELLPAGECGVTAVARSASYLAAASSQQCGPCAFGLHGVSAALDRVASCTANADELTNLHRWTEQLPGRGACHLPDGAAAMLRSAFQVFAAEIREHVAARRCSTMPIAVPAA